MNDATLTVRFISDMYQYDYIYDYVLYQNGAIEIKTILTGVLLSSAYYPEQTNKYGYEVSPHVLGSIHDHFLLYKLDLDILGTKNNFKTIDLVTEKFKNQWEPFPTTQKYLKHNEHKTELNATMKYNFDNPKYYVVYNENMKNRFGNVRGYRIEPIDKIKQVYPDENRGTKSTQWSKYQLSWSKFKETQRFERFAFILEKIKV